MSTNEQSLSIIKLISQLDKCSSSQCAYKLLVQIRTDVIKDKEGVKLLRDKGGLKHIVKALSKSNEKVLNVSLSILANCCMQEECRNQVIAYGAIPLITNILKNLNQDSIQNRACRLIGNLTQNKKIAEKLHEYHISPLLVAILNNSSCVGTLLMSIRSLRLLWDVSKYRTEMLKAEVVKAVAVHLVSKDKDLKMAVLKALATFTNGIKSLGIAQQVQGGQSNFALLVEETGNFQANLCLYNLSTLEDTRLHLVKDGLVEVLVKKLNSDIDHWLAMIFCLLCLDSIGRAHVRYCPGGLQLLLTLLRSNKSKVIQAKALKAIYSFPYDKPSLKILILNGLVPTLIKILADYVTKHGRAHDANAAAPEPPVRSVSPSSSGMSPQSRVGGQWSPISDDLSPPSSPISVYSPLCISDDELDATPVLTDDDVNMSVVEQQLENKASELNEEDMILSFLHHISNFVDIPVSDFATKQTTSTLINYIRLIRGANFRAGKLLCVIAGNKDYFRQLLDDQFVLEVHCRLCRPSHMQCSECERLLEEGVQVLQTMSMLAQSGLGEGEIVYRLLKSDEPTKQLVSLTIPLVIGQTDLLLKMLFRHDAISILMEALEKGQEDAVASFHALFKTLRIQSPQNPTGKEICTHCNVGSLRKESTITFILDDGSTVSANKSTLCNNSPVFEAMFRGSFQESKQAEVKLKDISADCLTYFSRIIDIYCECILPKDVKTMLEMIVASDRFLVHKLGVQILSVIMNHSLNYDTCCAVYNWALDVGYKYPVLVGSIANDVVKFIFTSKMTSTQRTHAVMLLLNSNHKKEFLEDVLELIKNELF